MAIVERLQFSGVLVFEVRVAVVAVVSESIFPSIEAIVAGLLFKQGLCGEKGVDNSLTLFGVSRWRGELANSVSDAVADGVDVFKCSEWSVVVGKFGLVEKEFEFSELVDGIGDRESRVDFGVRIFTNR